MKSLFTRRNFLAGVTAITGLSLTGCKKEVYVPPHLSDLLDASDALNMGVQRMLMSKQSMAPEYLTGDISPMFPVEGTSMPVEESYQQSLDNDFSDYRLTVSGLVNKPLELSLADIKHFESRTQITSHSCESGWTAIAQWTGVQLAKVLQEAEMDEKARYIEFECVDGWYDYLDLYDALHAQTILAYSMNGDDLPVPHGAPVRLRVELQLGYKSLKFITSINVVEHPQKIPTAGYGRVNDFAWYAGI